VRSIGEERSRGSNLRGGGRNRRGGALRRGEEGGAGWRRRERVGGVGARTVFVGGRGEVGRAAAGQGEAVSVVERMDGVGWGIRGRLRISFFYSPLKKNSFQGQNRWAAATENQEFGRYKI
jgi:hypothetical protein